ncbi:MAG: hemerythrin domain-containing protein [Polyangiales bacterium]
MTHHRPSLYRDIHKAVRLMLHTLVGRASRTDFDDPSEVAALRADTLRTFGLLESHAEHENTHMNPIVARVAPEVAQRLDDEHDEQTLRMHGLLELLDAGETSPAGRGHVFVVSLSRFFAEVESHMADEEELAMPAIWSALDDDAILAVEHAIVASIPPDERMQWMRWFLPALPARDREAMLTGMKQGAPPEAFAATLALAREVLPASEHPALERLAA